MTVKLDPPRPFQRFPQLPHQMRDRRTRTEDAIVLCHLGVPRIDASEWSLSIDGLVESPLTLAFDDLLRYPRSEVTSVHQCCGSPFAPFAPTRRVGNIVWAGARLADVLADSHPRPTASCIWSYGADFGQFGGVVVDAFGKDLEIARVGADVLIAYEMNGRPLPPEHGFPARLLVPGFYGTNSVKWLTRMTLAEGRMSAPFTTRWYSDPVLDLRGDETGETTPVWSIAPDSVIVSPAPQEPIELAREREIWGWAWADGGVGSVNVRISDETGWQSAQLESPQGREWQRFALVWTPTHPGPALITSRAAALTGKRQPLAGRRNEVHSVAVNVV
jgi:DMSO/TMAO reductase YedYZ molybdopterin-dependent catalytic subunit